MKNQLFESVGTFLSTTGTDPDPIPPKSDKGSRQNLCLIPKLKLKDYRYCSSVVLKLFLGDLTSFLFTFYVHISEFDEFRGGGGKPIKYGSDILTKAAINKFQKLTEYFNDDL